MTKLTTHVLDVYSGKPGNGITVDLFYINNNERKKIKLYFLKEHKEFYWMLIMAHILT